MAFFALLWKARTIEKYRLNYEKEKINSIVMANTHMEQTFSQRWRHYRYDTQKRISRTFKKWYPDGSGVANFFLYLKTDQTYPNFLLKSMMGFVGGIILTYLCFMFFVFQLSISLIHATIMSSIIGVLLTLGLAFSYRIRCLVFLLIPQFFSRVGRYTLTCYALVLILTGPATNTLKNSEVLSESMACTQEQIKTTAHQLDELMQTPQNSMKDSMKLMIDKMNSITMQIQKMLVKLNRLIMSIVGTIYSSFSWLQVNADICNAKLGSPYSRCISQVKEVSKECQDLLSPHISKICNIAHLGPTVCATTKHFGAYCYVIDFMDEAILASLRKQLKSFTAQIRALFYVEVHIRQSYSFSHNGTRTASQVAAGIVTEIRNRTGPLLTWLSWSSCVTSLFLLLIIFRAKYYQHMYETRSRFDNRYMTKELQELDLKRQRQGRETILPLNRRERAKYITTSSFHLVTTEKLYLTRSAVFMAITTFKLLIHMVADYSLYWVLMTIRYHGKYQSHVMPGVSQSGAYVSGKGFVARLFRSIVNTLNIPLSQPPMSQIPCLPDPYPPDFRRYTQIGVLIILLWFFALFEPYGLRMRHLIMGKYRPERAKARANWLYNHILRTRAGFMKFARRKLHREFKYSTETNLTFANWLNEHIPFQCLKYLLGIAAQLPHCVLCRVTSSNNKNRTLTRCKTPKCPGIYCSECFNDLGQLCTICLSPVDYGDLSDVSLEGGSSDESDSGAECYGTVNRHAANARFPEQFHSSDRLPTIRSTGSRRWRFFDNNFRLRPEDGTTLVESVDYEYQTVFGYHLNKERINVYQNIIQQNKRQYQCRARMVKKQRPDKLYDFDDNNNVHILQQHSDNNNKFANLSKGDIQKSAIIINKQSSSTSKIHNKESNNSFNQHKGVTESKSTDQKPSNGVSKDYGDSSKNNMNTNAVTNSRHAQNTQSVTHDRKKDNKLNIKNSKIKGVLKAVRFFGQNANQLESTNKDKAEQPNKAEKKKTSKNKGEEDKTTQCQKDTNGVSKDEPPEGDKSKKTNKEKVKRVRIKTSQPKISEFHNFFSSHWKSVKFNLAFRTSKKSKMENAVQRDKKNHKRRKKRKENISLEKIKESKEAKMDNKRTRNYRISAFLADLDWMKRDYKFSKKAIRGTDDSCRVSMPASCSRLGPNDTTVAMVQLTSKPFQWRDNARGGEYKDSFHRRYSCSDSSYKMGPNDNTQRALQRFRKKVDTSIRSPPSSFVQRMLSSINMGRKYSVNADSSIYLSKRASFYRSFREDLLNAGNSEVIDTDIIFKNQGFEDEIIPLESNPAISDLTSHKKVVNANDQLPSVEHMQSQLGTAAVNAHLSNSSVQAKKDKLMDTRKCKCRDDASVLQFSHLQHVTHPDVANKFIRLWANTTIFYSVFAVCLFSFQKLMKTEEYGIFYWE